MDLVDRVARAICKSRSCEGVNCCQWPANRGRMTCPAEIGGYTDAAVAAVELICAVTNNQQLTEEKRDAT